MGSVEMVVEMDIPNGNFVIHRAFPSTELYPCPVDLVPLGRALPAGPADASIRISELFRWREGDHKTEGAARRRPFKYRREEGTILLSAELFIHYADFC